MTGNGGGAAVLLQDLRGLGWQDRALCTQFDPETFFPQKGGSTKAAKRVCQSCEVRRECLDYAQAHGIRDGIWGGLSDRERLRARQDNSARPSAAAARADTPPAEQAIVREQLPAPDVAVPPPAAARTEYVQAPELPGPDRVPAVAEPEALSEPPKPAEPPAAATAKRCRKCGYFTSSPGHRVICEDGS